MPNTFRHAIRAGLCLAALLAEHMRHGDQHTGVEAVDDEPDDAAGRDGCALGRVLLEDQALRLARIVAGLELHDQAASAELLLSLAEVQSNQAGHGDSGRWVGWPRRGGWANSR